MTHLNKRIEAELRNDDEDWKRRIKTPRVGVAAVIESQASDALVLIEREFPPYGTAFPGGFMDLGEMVEETGVRESWEETGLAVTPVGLLNVTSEPDLDPRMHLTVIAAVFHDTGKSEIRAGDDAKHAMWLPWNEDRIDGEDFLETLTPRTRIILDEYRFWRNRKQFPYPLPPLR
jgi:8-oxo-dGTP diphosphatase